MEKKNHALSHASSALHPGFQFQEHLTDVDKPDRMTTTWIPNPHVVWGAGSCEKAFVAQAGVLPKPFRDK